MKFTINKHLYVTEQLLHDSITDHITHSEKVVCVLVRPGACYREMAWMKNLALRNGWRGLGGL